MPELQQATVVIMSGKFAHAVKGIFDAVANLGFVF